MVSLNQIYTRTGDDGTTMLGDCSRVPKTDARVRAYGSVDELNSLLGVALLADIGEPVRAMLQAIQNELFDLGSDLCTPLSEAEIAGDERRANRVPGERHQRLEAHIDRLQEQLEPLKSFVLPGGSPAASWLHLARTVARRAELETLELGGQAPVNPDVAIYLNRLSDLLFVMARWCNLGGSEVLWQPGGAPA